MAAPATPPASFLLPVDTPPMEAKLGQAIPRESGVWQYEPKWDGFRCLAFKSRDTVNIRAKSGKSLARYFPELVALLGSLKALHFVVDGEIVIERFGEPSFEALQMRLHPAASRVRRLAVETPAMLVLFDILVDPGGRVLTDLPLAKRRASLASFVRSSKRKAIALSPTLSLKEAEAWLEGAGYGKTDGVVAKRIGDPYMSGQRAMVKIKRMRTADCVVGSFRYLADKPQVGSLLLGLYDSKGKLDHVGFTSTIANGDRAALTRRLEALRNRPGVYRQSSRRTESMEH